VGWSRQHDIASQAMSVSFDTVATSSSVEVTHVMTKELRKGRAVLQGSMHLLKQIRLGYSTTSEANLSGFSQQYAVLRGCVQGNHLAPAIGERVICRVERQTAAVLATITILVFNGMALRATATPPSVNTRLS
jgi:hypothetical protein